MAVLQVGILLRVDEQGFQGCFWLTETGGCHRRHAVVPAPGGGPVPVVHHPGQRAVGCDSIAAYGTLWQQTKGAKHGGMVVATLLVEGFCSQNGLGTSTHSVEGVEALQVLSLADGEARGVDAVLHRQRRQVGRDVVPQSITLLALTLAPGIGHAETIAPIGQLERMVIAKVFRHRLLHGRGALEKILLFPVGNGNGHADEIGHKRCRLLHLLSILGQRGGGGVGTIHLLSHIYIMWLLPDEERAGVRRGLARPWVGHLHPACSLEALALGNLLSDGESDVIVPFEHISHHFRTTPQCEVDHVPPRHLQMGTTEPRIVRQSRLLRGHVVGAVHLREVLREHHAALQFLGTRVGALREVDDGAVVPPAVPSADDALELLVEIERIRNGDWVFLPRKGLVGSLE